MMESVLAVGTQAAQQAVLEKNRQTLDSLVQQNDLKKAAEAFESYFLAFLMKIMRQTVPETALTGNQMGELFQSFYDEEISRLAALNGGIGLARFIETTMQATMEETLQERGSA